MYITDVSIRRPVVAWVMSLILVVFGIFVFSKLPVRELPDGLQPPVVQIKVDYKSASAPIIDQEVTQVIEDVVGGTEGIKNIDSKSENGSSTINVEFETNIDLDDAANDIRERVARIVDNLPNEAKAPQILKQAAGFTTTMWIAVTSSTWSDLELGDYTERYLVDQFSSVKNVGRIRTGGLRDLSVRVWVDPIKLAANNTTSDILDIGFYGVANTGTSNTHVAAIANSIRRHVSKKLKEKPFGTEGTENQEWVLIDYVDVVVHIFQQNIREYYDIENLWGDAKITNVKSKA